MIALVFFFQSRGYLGQYSCWEDNPRDGDKETWHGVSSILYGMRMVSMSLHRNRNRFHSFLCSNRPWLFLLQQKAFSLEDMRCMMLPWLFDKIRHHMRGCLCRWMRKMKMVVGLACQASFSCFGFGLCFWNLAFNFLCVVCSFGLWVIFEIVSSRFRHHPPILQF